MIDRVFLAFMVAVVFETGIHAETLPPAAGPQTTRPWVTVTPAGPNDGGDFGPNTPGTKTSGLQEAINHAREIQRDVYVAGGGAKEAFKNPVVYFMSETLHIPWMQDFRFDSGQCVIQYTGEGDAIVFDSQMSCWYKFPLVVSSGKGAVIRLKPSSIGPDNFSVITASRFSFGAIVGAGNVFPGAEAKGVGTGLFLDAAAGPVDGNEFFISEAIGCETGIRLTEGCTNNWIRSPFTHLCGTHLEVGEPGGNRARLNRIEAYIDGQGIANNTGVVLHGQNNLLTLSFGSNAEGKNLILSASAKDNQITLINLPNGITEECPRDANLFTGRKD